MEFQVQRRPNALHRISPCNLTQVLARSKPTHSAPHALAACLKAEAADKPLDSFLKFHSCSTIAASRQTAGDSAAAAIDWPTPHFSFSSSARSSGRTYLWLVSGCGARPRPRKAPPPRELNGPPRPEPGNIPGPAPKPPRPRP